MAEDKSPTQELQFEKHELYNRRIVTRCRSGYELYQQLICGRPILRLSRRAASAFINFIRLFIFVY